MRICKVRTCKATLPKGSPLRHCSPACGEVLALEAVEKRRAQIAKARNKVEREQKRHFRLKDKSHQMRLTQAAFNALIRLLDQDRGCISCDKGPQWSGQWHAGHYKTTGAVPAMRLDPWNAHRQCSRCNLHLSGALTAYRDGLLSRYGQGIVDYLEGHHGAQNWTGDDLVELRALYNAEIRRLEAGQPPSRIWRAIPTPAESPT